MSVMIRAQTSITIIIRTLIKRTILLDVSTNNYKDAKVHTLLLGFLRRLLRKQATTTLSKLIDYATVNIMK